MMYMYMYAHILLQGCVTLYGDPSDVLQQGFDVMDLLGANVDLDAADEQDPRKVYAVRKHSAASTLEQDGKQENLSCFSYY